MELNFEILVSRILEDIKSSISNYLLDNGFKQINSYFEKIEFKRGNILRNFFTSNPAKWKTKILIELYKISRLQTKVIVRINVSTVGQTVTLQENNFWLEFSEKIKLSIIENEDHIKEEDIEGKKVASFNIPVLKRLGLQSLIYFSIMIPICILTKSKYIVLSTLNFFIIFIMYRHNKIINTK